MEHSAIDSTIQEHFRSQAGVYRSFPRRIAFARFTVRRNQSEHLEKRLPDFDIHRGYGQDYQALMMMSRSPTLWQVAPFHLNGESNAFSV
jgi:hypothetical protein